MTVCTPTRLLALAALAAAVSGCSNTGAPLATASVAPDKPVVSQPRIDPACVALASQIDTLRAEGTAERLEKAADGKSANVQVKRASLAKQAELNKANADFQTKCGPPIPRAQTATMAPPSGVATTTPPRKIDSAPVGN